MCLVIVKKWSRDAGSSYSSTSLQLQASVYVLLGSVPASCDMAPFATPTDSILIEP